MKKEKLREELEAINKALANYISLDFYMPDENVKILKLENIRLDLASVIINLTPK